MVALIAALYAVLPAKFLLINYNILIANQQTGLKILITEAICGRNFYYIKSIF
jgi:hypothetical protein